MDQFSPDGNRREQSQKEHLRGLTSFSTRQFCSTDVDPDLLPQVLSKLQNFNRAIADGCEYNCAELADQYLQVASCLQGWLRRFDSRHGDFVTPGSLGHPCVDIGHLGGNIVFLLQFIEPDRFSTDDNRMLIDFVRKKDGGLDGEVRKRCRRMIEKLDAVRELSGLWRSRSS